MASDVIESEAVLKGVSDMNLNNRSPDFVTPRTQDELGNAQTPSPSSSGVSGEGDDEEELDELQNSAASMVENGEDALQESPTKTRGTPQERTNPDNEQKQPGARSSTPVNLPQLRSPSGPTGRCVCILSFCLRPGDLKLFASVLFHLFVSLHEGSFLKLQHLIQTIGGVCKFL